MNHKKIAKLYGIDLTKNDDLIFELSNLVTEARIFSGYSQTELAKKIGTKQPSIARAEKGELEVTNSFLKKIALAVGTKFIPPRFGFMDSMNMTYGFVTTSPNSTIKLDILHVKNDLVLNKDVNIPKVNSENLRKIQLN